MRDGFFEVGGAVRDRLLGGNPEDIDFVAVGKTKEELLGMGMIQVRVGNAPVFLDKEGVVHPRAEDEEAAEIAMARAEIDTGESSEDFDFRVDGVALEEDLVRRDLTINAMAQDHETGKIIDPFGGQEDLEAGVLRHVSDAFSEDPVRVLRLARFASRFPEFEIAPETIEIATETAPKIVHEPVERVRDEMLKALKQAEEPRRFFDVLREVGALPVTFHEIDALVGIRAGPVEYHGERDVFEHSMMVLTEAHRQVGNDVTVLLGALVHDIGKAVTAHDDSPDHRHHVTEGEEIAEAMARRLHMSNEHRRIMTMTVRQHMRFHEVPNMQDAKVLHLARDLGDTDLGVDGMLEVALADDRGRIPRGEGDRETFRERLDPALEALNEIDGGDIIEQFDVDPATEGEKIGHLLHQEQVRLFREVQ
jgi:tRNA nucleotidyltransferase (CCA-adding enzyme)